MEGGPVYTATKCGVVGHTQALSLDCMKNHGVRVNAMCPSLVDTRLVRGLEGSGSKVMDNLIGMLGTLLRPCQIAEGFLELVLDQSRNGTVMKMFHDGRIEYEDPARAQPAQA
ncbi:15-hydroxyprostaglandin dehydrogenase [NAD(+)]-like [Rhinoraja longicauda]